MRRKQFLFLMGAIALALFVTETLACQVQQHNLNPQTYYFKDDGKIPNSKYPLLVYRNAFSKRGSIGASWLEARFAANNWIHSWRNGVFPLHHYHSTSHEVLGVYSGSALLHMGGENGEKIRVNAGDVLVIPAGVGHKNLGSSDDFAVVVAYPDGMTWDLLKGEPGERLQADKNIAALPLPDFDPLQDTTAGLREIWK